MFKITIINKIVRNFILVMLSFSFLCANGQISKTRITDTVTIAYDHAFCKLPLAVRIGIPQTVFSEAIKNENKSKEIRNWNVDGDLSHYHFSRNSASDDVFLGHSQSDITTLRLNFLYKEDLPFKLNVRYNRTSPFQMDDQWEVSTGFDEQNHKKIVQQRLINAIKQKFQQHELDLRQKYNATFAQYEMQMQTLNSPVFLQQSIEERLKRKTLNDMGNLPEIPEGKMPEKTSKLPALFNNSLNIKNKFYKQEVQHKLDHKLNVQDNSVVKKQLLAYNTIQTKKDSLKNAIKGIEDSIAVVKSKMNQRIDSVNKELADITSTRELMQYGDANGVKDSIGSSGILKLISRSKIRLGKFLMDQSELTVSNIFLHGISYTYGNTKFATLSGGKFDFGFRRVFNFRDDSLRENKQGLVALKLGKYKGKNLSAVNLYLGKKDKTIFSKDNLETVAGISFEKKVYLHKNLSFNVEIAKSTSGNGITVEKEKTFVKDLFGFNSRAIGINSNVTAYLPSTQTNAELSYSYWGQEFESFSAIQNFNPRNKMAIKLGQPLLKRRLFLNAGLRYSDYKNYVIANNIKTKTYLGSATATLRLKKLPLITVGYFPGNQLYWLDNNKLYEYNYYILNATASHSYKLLRIPIQATFSYNKFFNKYTDSLVKGSQSCYNLYLSTSKDKFNYLFNYSYQEIEEQLLKVLEMGISYSTTRCRLGSSLKFNVMNTKTQLGYAANLAFIFPRLGTVSFVYDKSYLPERHGNFIPIKTGQVQIVKPLKFRL